MTATFAKTFTKDDIVMFSVISGPINAVRLKEEYPANMPSRDRMVVKTICRVEGVAVVESDAQVNIGSSTWRATQALRQAQPA